MFKSLLILSAITLSFALNQRPIIGVQDQPLGNSSTTTYIAASYIKFLEAGGARIVRIPYDAPLSYYDQIFEEINGLLLPGGDTDFVDATGKPTLFATNAAYMVQKAMNFTDNGNYFPVWGTCQGIELLHFIFSGMNIDVLSDIGGELGVQRTLQWTSDARDSRLYQNLSDYLYKTAQVDDLVYANHHETIEQSAYEKFPKLKEVFDILAYSHNDTGTKYVTAVEGKQYPIYATQFHPEKNAFEWNVDAPHTLDSIKFMQYLTDTFVQESRKNLQSFSDAASEKKALIDNYAPVFTDSGFYQTYIFNN